MINKRMSSLSSLILVSSLHLYFAIPVIYLSQAKVNGMWFNRKKDSLTAENYTYTLKVDKNYRVLMSVGQPSPI
jgi:hypothetical protein